MNLEQLHRIMPLAQSRAYAAIDALNAAMDEWEINTRDRQAYFLAHLAHESGELRYVREIASGVAYEGAARLGNTRPGDGPAFKGWDWMQITGRKNTRLASLALYGDERLIDTPELLNHSTPERAARSAAWFWTAGAGLNLGRAAHEHGIADGCNLNDLADAGDFLGTTLAVNGGMNGYPQRSAYLNRALEILT